jgi:hypothetical protein
MAYNSYNFYAHLNDGSNNLSIGYRFIYLFIYFNVATIILALNIEFLISPLVNFNGLNVGMFASHGEIFIAKNNLNDEEI